MRPRITSGAHQGGTPGPDCGRYPLPFTLSGIDLSVQLPQAFTPADTITFTVHYSGDPALDPSGFGGFEAKMVLVPLLSEAIDEPSAYDAPEDVGENLPRAR